MRTMVTGGAGYIGSVITLRLLEAGHDVVVFDDLSRGHRSAVPADAQLVVGDVRDADLVTTALTTAGCTTIVHMAALAEVAESVVEPDLYYDVNVNGTRSLLEAARRAEVEGIVFSSTAAVYGAPDTTPLTETAQTAPTNPYGATKLTAERVLSCTEKEGRGDRSAAATRRPAVTALRYFNACGAYDGCGEDHRPESHLIPLALRAVRDDRDVSVFGTDYPTPDGTCVRDYVHVADLADAHVMALEHLPTTAGVFNLGTGTGASVLDVLRAIGTITGLPVKTEVGPRRAGDPPVLVAANDGARAGLGWRPRRGLRDAVADAWEWMQTHPEGYRD